MAEQKVKLTQLPAANDTSDTAQLLVNQNQTDQRLPVTHFLRAKKNLSDLQDNVQARANIGATSPDEVDNKIKNLFDGKATFLNGGSLASRKDLIWDDSSKSWYFWSGNLPKQVPAASSPQDTGGVSSGAWVSVGNSTLSSTEDGLGDALICVKQPYAGAVARTQHDKNSDALSVKDFGAKGDGVTDDTNAIQALIDLAKEKNIAGFPLAVFLPPGTYIVDSLTIYAHTVMYGAGRATIIRRKPGGSKSVIYGVNSSSLWGTTSSNATEFAYNFTLSDFVVDGGVDGKNVPFSSSLTGHGIAIWGSRYRMFNIDIINCAEKGIYTDYIDQNLDYLAPWFESSIFSIRINNCGKEGWHCAGPHDAAIHDVGIINGSRIGNALYDGFYVTKNMSGNIGNLHVSNGEDNTGTGAAIRHRYAGNIEGPCRFYGGTTFEGAKDCVRLASSGVQFDDSCTFYIPWGDGYNGTVMWVEGGVAFCIIRGKFGGSGSFKKQTNWGVRFRPGNGYVSHNDIDVLMEGIDYPISFGDSTSSSDSDGGMNRIKILAYFDDGTSKSLPSTYGIPNTGKGTEIDIKFTGNSNSRIKSAVQTKVITMASGASYTWNYKYPFLESPAVSIAIVGIGGTPTGQLYSAGVSSTQAVFHNGTGQSLTLHATATMRVSE